MSILAIIFCAFCSISFAQAPKPVEFDVADIRLNDSGDQKMTGGILPGGQFSIRNASMEQLVKMAYGLHFSYVDQYIVGAPPWFASDRFDIIGKAPANTPNKTLYMMLRSLIEREFKLKMRQEQKSMSVYVLNVAKGGPKLVQAPVNEVSDWSRAGDQGSNVPAQRVVCTNMTMAALADELPEISSGYFDRPVVDQTGLKGGYDFTLDWVARKQIETGGLTLFDALEKQIGIKVQSRKVPVPVYVVEHAEKLAAK